jgi:aerobic carbon-monoxide dehydrogenase medium subunit
LPLFRPEEFVKSKNEQEILGKLKSQGRRGRIIAGGTGFYELARRGYIPEVKTVVSVMDLGLSYLNEEKNCFVIGATTTLQELLDSELVKAPGLEGIDDALREIRPVQVRNVATVGGEICISVPIVDLPTALLACEASIRIVSESGDRDLSLDEFYIDAFLTKLQDGELVKEVIIQKPPSKTASAFVKFGRTAYDFNLINCAASLSCDPSKSKIESLRIVLGGIKRVPMRSLELERKLLGKAPNDESAIIETVENSFSKTNFLPSVHGSNEYKHAIVPIVIRDCIFKAYERCK